MKQTMQNIKYGAAAFLFVIITLMGFSQPVNNDQANAILLNDLDNWCSGFMEYTNMSATNDVASGSCWKNNSGNGHNNVWFKFQATTTNVTVKVLTEAFTGFDMRGQQMSLLDVNNVELACSVASDWYYGVLSISYAGLTVGDWYYVMVDSRRADGFFSLCIDDQLDNDYRIAADTLGDLNGWCSGSDVYTNLSATSDETAASCWMNNGGTGNKNVWFIFQATTADVKIDIASYPGNGNIKGQQYTLYDLSLNELRCVVSYDHYVGNAQSTYTNLTIGDWYYIAVDARRQDGYFEICVDDQPGFDKKEGAITIPNISNYCSGINAYSNWLATADQTPGSCWQNNGGTGTKNVWFKFQATTPYINIDVSTVGGPRNMRGQQYVLYDAALSEIECMVTPDWYTGDAEMTYEGLTVGDWYYIAVDSRRKDGNFQLCLDDQPGFDNLDGAIVINSISEYCSDMISYSSLVATDDETPGTCWQDNGGTGNSNVWFKFQATTQIVSIDILTENGNWNMRGQQYVLYDDALNELECMLPPDWYYGSAEMTYFGLTVGDWYYIAVDSRRDDGFFQICVDDQPGFDFKEGAIVVPNISNYCSGFNTFTNLVATADQQAGSCWQDDGGTGNNNVWFTFQATTSVVTVDVVTANGSWRMRGQQYALYDAALNELECVVAPDYYFGNAEMTYYGLTPGNWYYIAVDSRRDNGYFEICIDDQPGFDFKDGAVHLTDLDDYCSGQVFTNITSTADQSTGSCWFDNGGSGNKNVWFTFQATTNSIVIDVVTSHTLWAMRGQQYVLYDDALNPLQCVASPDFYYGNAEMTYCDLTIGNWYYIAVDSRRDDGYFEICVTDKPGYDCMAGAEPLDNLNDWCSAVNEFSTLTATSDHYPGTCWEDYSGTGSKNVWFTFNSASTGVLIDVATTSGIGNYMISPNIALYDASGNQLACVSSADWYYGATNLSYLSLNEGNTYYIAVDGAREDGLFQICIDNVGDSVYWVGDGLTNNWSDSDNWSNVSGGDGTTTSYIPEPIDYVFFDGVTTIADKNCLFDMDVQVNACQILTAYPGTVDMNGNDFTLYGIGASDFQSGNVIDNVGGGTCSVYTTTTVNFGGTTFGTSVSATGGLRFGGSTFNSSFTGIHTENTNTYNSGTNVFGGDFELSVTKPSGYFWLGGSDIFNGNIVVNGTSGQDIILDGSTLANGKTITVGNSGFTAGELDLRNFTQVGTTSQNLILTGTASLIIGSSTFNGDLTATLTGTSTFKTQESAVFEGVVGVVAPAIYLNGATFNDNTTITKTGSSQDICAGGNTFNGQVTNINIDGTGEWRFAAGNSDDFNGVVNYNVSSSGILRPAYSSSTSFACNVNFNSPSSAVVFGQAGGIVSFDGSLAQEITDISPSVMPVFNYVTVNNASATGLTLNRKMLVGESITFLDGFLYASSGNELIIADDAMAYGASNTSFVHGPVAKRGDDSFTFPVGDAVEQTVAEISISAPSAVTDEFTAYYKNDHPNTITDVTSLDPTLEKVSSMEYWILDRTAGSSAVAVTLSWENSRSGNIASMSDLAVSRWNGFTWRDHGNGGTTGTSSNGTIISSAAISSFSPFTLATRDSIANPLPIELVLFEANTEGDQVNINWVTGTEINNDYFTVERSGDNINFIPLVEILGKLNSSSLLRYQHIDKEPLEGVSYYRLKQTDIDGKTSYSQIEQVHFFGSEAISGTFVYPNPVRGISEISISATKCFEPKTEVSITLIDITGKELLRQTVFTDHSGSFVLQLDSQKPVSNGMHLIRYESIDTVFTETIVINEKY